MVFLKFKPFLLLFLGAALFLPMLGCSVGKKPETQKDLVKLSLDTQEEARKLRDAGNLESAVVKYQEALRYHVSPSLHQELGGVLVDLNRFPEARKQYELALVESPGMREAEVALEQLDARIELANADRLPAAGQKKSSAVEEFQTADTSSAKKNSGQFDFMDDEAAFREMSGYSPADAPSSTGSSEGAGGSELAQDARSLFGVEEENLDLDYTPEGTASTADSGMETFAASPPPTDLLAEGTKGRPIAPTTSTLGAKKPLPGGRGLIHSRGLVSQVVASGPPMPKTSPPTPGLVDDLSLSDPYEGFDPDAQAPLVATASPPGPVEPRGGRGLSGVQRLPSTKQSESVQVEDKGIGTYIPKSNTPSGSAGKSGTGSTELAKNPDLPPDSSGLFDSDPIVYPTPQPKETDAAAKPLPAPGFEKEVMDLSGSSFSERFKGRRAQSLDLESCKRRFYEEKDLEGAIRCFRDKRIDFPESSELHYELGKIYETSGQFPLAREEYLLAIRYSPDNETYNQALASVEVGQARQLIDQGNYLPATEILIQTVERYPNMAPAYRELAKAYSKSALNREQELAASGLQSPEVKEAIATEWRRAEASYRKLLDLSGDDYKDWYNYAVAVQSQYDSSKDRVAINAYEKTLEMNPTFWDAHYNVAILYEGKSPQKALYHYEEALSLARNDTGPEGKSRRIQCLGALGELYWRTNQTEKAADYLTEYMRLVPDDAHIEQILEQITSAPAIGN